MSDQEEVVALLRRNNELLTILVKAEIGAGLEAELAIGKNRKLYELVGKGATVRDMANQLGTSKATISRTLQDWETKGFLIKDSQKYRRVFDAE